jgi:hypothetical protein
MYMVYYARLSCFSEENMSLQPIIPTLSQSLFAILLSLPIFAGKRFEVHQSDLRASQVAFSSLIESAPQRLQFLWRRVVAGSTA